MVIPYWRYIINTIVLDVLIRWGEHKSKIKMLKDNARGFRTRGDSKPPCCFTAVDCC